MIAPAPLERPLALSQAEIDRALASLDPETPWTHYFRFADTETITAGKDEKFYRKAIGLGRLGALAVDIARHHTRAGGVAGQRIIDIASAEGAHAALFAHHGAREVLGVEGRDLYVRRAEFAARAYGMDNVRFVQGDVRRIDPAETGRFDIVFCSGILHHLGKDDFWPMLKTLHALTGDMLFLYTHVAHPDRIAPYRLKATNPVNGKYAGYLFQEHDENASTEQRQAQVRASLDNTWSFWATPGALIDALRDVGFATVSSIVHPHLFGRHEDRIFRPIVVARR